MLQVQNALEDNVVVSNANGIHQAKAKYFFLERYENAYNNELVHFIKSVQTGVEPSVDISDGVLALRIAEAAQKSLKTGNPVNL